MQSLNDLIVHRSLVDVATWSEGPGGLPMLTVRTDQCDASLFAWGAHVATWTPSGHRPVLHMSSRSAFGGGKAIRGGVPLCVPWFGARSDDPKPGGKASPAHGFARTRPWHVDSVALDDDSGRVRVTFLLVSDDDTLALWPHAFEARFTALLGTTLTMTLEMKNVDDSAFDFEAALHTYFEVGDVQRIALRGLEGTRYVDKVDALKEKQTGRSPLVLRDETDAVFVQTKQSVEIDDDVLERTIRVDKQGSAATVVWNPWLIKATAMPDVGGDDWRSFVCVEAANVRPHPVPLSPGASHQLVQRVSVTRRRPLG